PRPRLRSRPVRSMEPSWCAPRTRPIAPSRTAKRKPRMPPVVPAMTRRMPARRPTAAVLMGAPGIRGRDSAAPGARAPDAAEAAAGPAGTRVPAKRPSLDPGGGLGLDGVVVGGQVHVVDGDVDLDDLEAGHALDGVDDVGPDRGAEIVDGDPVLRDDPDVDRRLPLADLDGDALGGVDPRSRDAPAQRSDE